MARRSLIAPALSVVGVATFAVFLWFWTGSPFADFIAQRDGWSEKTDVFAVLHLAQTTASQISLSHFDHPTIDLNLVIGLVGAIVLHRAARARGPQPARDVGGGDRLDARDQLAGNNIPIRRRIRAC